MLHTLIGVLRAIGFFEPDIVATQDKPSQYFPYVFGKDQERKHLLASMIKIDCYLSILQVQPPLLLPEELQYDIPCSFALWNSPGTSVFESRHREDPFMHRCQKSIYQLLRDPSAAILIEDSQLGLCGTQYAIWQLNKLEQSDSHNLGTRRDIVRQTHEGWKYSINEQGNRLAGVGEPHLLKTQTLWCYHGNEDYNEADWTTIIERRPQTIFFDTLMLYHLQGIHVNANIQSLTKCARALKEQTADPSIHAAEDLDLPIRSWVAREEARRAVGHAASLLRYHQCSHFNFTPWTADPIAHAAMATSALVIWAYIKYADQICSACGLVAPKALSMPMVELTDWNPDPIKTWISEGGAASICAFELCLCNVEELVDACRKCLPLGNRAWKHAGTIAPML